MINMDELKFNEQGLIPAIAQDYITGNILMLAYMNVEAINKTVETNIAHYFSRSRKNLWLKGETSGNLQHVKEILIDCDNDTIVLKVQQDGVACHTGNYTCFYKKLSQDGIIENEEKDANEEKGENVQVEITSPNNILIELYNLIEGRRTNPVEGSYTNYLFDKGIDKILKKVGEEASEVIIAAKNNSSDELRYEIADLFYHLSVLMVEQGLKIQDVFEELKKRNK